MYAGIRSDNGLVLTRLNGSHKHQWFPRRTVSPEHGPFLTDGETVLTFSLSSLAWRTKFFVWILISRGWAKVNLTNVIYFQNTETGRKCLWKLWESASEGIRKLCYDTVRKQGQGRLTENVWGPMFWAFYHSESQMHMWLKNKKIEQT